MALRRFMLTDPSSAAYEIDAGGAKHTIVQIDDETGIIYASGLPINSGGGDINFSDAATPVGDIDGVNDTFILEHAPDPPESLLLAMNAGAGSGTLLLQQGVDYTLSGSTITFTSPPEIGSVLIAWYRY